MMMPTAALLLDILCAVPQELHRFAAKILLPAFSSVVEHSSSILLKACKRDEHRLVLHMLGLALGTEEWTNDYKVRILAPPTEGTAVQGAKPAHESVHQKPATNQSELIAAESNPETYEISGKLENVEPETQDMETESSSVEFGFDQGHRTLVTKVPLDVAADLDFTQRSRDIVESIRRDEFGIGQDLKIQEQDLLLRQHARMGRALHRLSQDLYSQDSHFVLELVRAHHLYFMLMIAVCELGTYCSFEAGCVWSLNLRISICLVG